MNTFEVWRNIKKNDTKVAKFGENSIFSQIRIVLVQNPILCVCSSSFNACLFQQQTDMYYRLYILQAGADISGHSPFPAHL